MIRLLDGWSVPVTRWNTETFPYQSELTVRMWSEEPAPWMGVAPSGQASVDLSRVERVWYRRVRAPTRPIDMDSGVNDYCLREARSALLGALLGAIPRSAAWMSAPDAIWRSEHKLLQLATARSLGLQVPDTLVTNDADEIVAAFRRFSGRMIAKPVRSGYVEVDEVPAAIFTSEILEHHLANIREEAFAPTIYQPLIPKRADVRVTWVSGWCVAAEIDSQSDEAASVDWRRTSNPQLPHRRVVLDDRTTALIAELMNILGLEFGALDFVRTANDELVFLEVNPNGQWLWLDDMLELGISEAIAHWLSGRG